MQNSAFNARILEKLPPQIKCLSEAARYHSGRTSVAAHDPSAGNVESSCK